MRNRNIKKWKVILAVFAIMIPAFILILLLFNQINQSLTETDYEQAEVMNELEGEYLGYISGFLESGGTSLVFKGIDWIADDKEPNGFRIEKSQEPEMVYTVNEDTEYGIIEGAICIQVGKKEFMKRLEEMENLEAQPVFGIKGQNGVIQRIREQYIP